MRKEDEFFERRIITGMIVSSDYLTMIEKFWDSSYLESSELRIIADWVMLYFKKYRQSPDENIQSIYMENLQKNTLSKPDAQYIELVLSDLSDEYGRGKQFNSAYLYDQTVKYLKTRELEQHNEEIQSLIDAGRIEEAEKLAQSFSSTIGVDPDRGLDLSTKEALDAVERAFSETSQKVLSYPGALGEMWNDHLVRGGLFYFLAPEKRGKTFFMMEMGLRAIRQKSNVAFFSAGDMTEGQMLKRICIYIARRSDKEKYCKAGFTPIGDCIYNQLDTCDRKDRNCDHGIFEDISLDTFHQNYAQFINSETLKEKYEEFPDYEPCDSMSCPIRKGSVWLKHHGEKRPLTASHAKRALRKFFKRYRRRFKLNTYPAGMLTVTEIRKCLDEWEKHDGFIPDIIIIDYADLLSADDGNVKEHRHKQDHIWKNLRALSQERHVLIITATQADANSYTKGRLSLSNFSEDKRKLAHVTAQYGLNQDPQGREKELGILRINEIVVREGEFSTNNEVYVLQDLASGRPFLESFK